MGFPAQMGRVNLSFHYLFILVRASRDWTRPTHIGEDQLLDSVHQFKLISSRNTLTDTPQNNIYQHSGHPLAASRWHMKLTITVVIGFMKKVKQGIGQSMARKGEEASAVGAQGPGWCSSHGRKDTKSFPWKDGLHWQPHISASVYAYASKLTTQSFCFFISFSYVLPGLPQFSHEH